MGQYMGLGILYGDLEGYYIYICVCNQHLCVMDVLKIWLLNPSYCQIMINHQIQGYLICLIRQTEMGKSSCETPLWWESHIHRGKSKEHMLMENQRNPCIKLIGLCLAMSCHVDSGLFAPLAVSQKIDDLFLVFTGCWRQPGQSIHQCREVCRLPNLFRGDTTWTGLFKKLSWWHLLKNIDRHKKVHIYPQKSTCHGSIGTPFLRHSIWLQWLQIVRSHDQFLHRRYLNDLKPPVCKPIVRHEIMGAKKRPRRCYRINIYIYTYIYTHTSVYIYIHICYMYINTLYVAYACVFVYIFTY